jgi:hypothetical protein
MIPDLTVKVIILTRLSNRDKRYALSYIISLLNPGAGKESANHEKNRGCPFETPPG